MDEAIVDKIVARILAQLAKEQISSEPKQVVMLFTGARAGTKAGLEAIRRLSGSKHSLTVMHTESARSIIPEDKVREAGATEIVGAGPWVDVAGLACKADLLLIPTLTTRMAGILALGLMDSPAATLVLRTLLAGKAVVAIKDGADPNGYVSEKIYGAKPGAAPALRAKLESYLAALSSFGVELVSEGDFLVRMERRLLTGPVSISTSNASVPVASRPATQFGGATIVTASELMHYVPGSTIRLGAGSRLTPQAEDTAKRLRLALEFV